MITCNRCGTTNPAGSLNCQTCGTPLVSRIENEPGPRMSAQSQPPVPPWLESLRAGDRPAVPSESPSGSGFSAADLLDEGTLPSWMRSSRSDQYEKLQSAGQQPAAPGSFSQSAPQSALRPSSLPSPNTGDEGLAPKGLSANSLIDEQSLPSWMQRSGTSPEPQSGISAASLLQSDSLPEWMKKIQPQQQPLNPGRPEQPAPFSQQPSAGPFGTPPPSAVPFATQQNSGMHPPVSGFSARDLIDPQALPSWMDPQSGQGAPAQNAQPPQSGQSGFAASSLLDEESLPPWLRQAAVGSQQAQPSSPMNQPSAQSSWQSPPAQQSGWPAMPSQPAWPTAQNQPASNQGQGGGISASSFIDANALPEWMSSGSERQVSPQQSAPGAGRSPAYGPQRGENIRVPSRPRNELSSPENSEVAAKTFASMLGVASTPQYPEQVPNAPFPQGNYQQQGQGMPQNMAASPYGQIPSSPSSFAAPQAPSGPGYGGPAAPMGGGYQGPGTAYQANSPYGGSPGNMSSSMGGNSAYPGNMQGASPVFPRESGEGERTPQKPAKRGFFDAIRDLFFR